MLKINKILLVAAMLTAGACVAVAGTHGGKMDKMDKRDILWKELPESVQKTITKKSGDMELEHLGRSATVDGEVAAYYATWRDGDKAVTVKVGPDGKLMDQKAMPWKEHAAAMKADAHSKKKHHEKHSSGY